MRNAFVGELKKQAHKNKNIILLTGDLGFSVFENFKEELPEQYINCGVAEQNMIGVAAGLALTGRKVFVYSIAPFVTFRVLEHLRDDVCLQDLDVKVIGVGGGFSYGILGGTHHAIEDVATVKSLPNIKVYVPSDPIETRFIMENLTNNSGPAYLRLGKKGEPDLFKNSSSFEFGKINMIKKGGKAAVFSMGPITGKVLNSIKKIEKITSNKIYVFSVNTVKPIDRETILKISNRVNVIISVEEHSSIGGLGDSIAAILAENCSKLDLIFKKIAVEDYDYKKIGNQDYLTDTYGISGSVFEKKVKEILSSL